MYFLCLMTIVNKHLDLIAIIKYRSSQITHSSIIAIRDFRIWNSDPQT
jgi:hypothetical protein